MKRSELKADPVKVAAWKARSQKPLKRSERPQNRRVSPSEAQSKGSGRGKPPRPYMSQSVCREVFLRQHGQCICGCGGNIAPFPIGYHHLWPKARWPEFTNEPNAIVGVAGDCHANHEAASKRLPRRACVRAEKLATTFELESYLTRTYGPPCK